MKTEKNDAVKLSKFIGAMIEYKTENMRLLLRVYTVECDDPKSKFFVNLTAYIIGSENGRKVMEAGDYDTYEEALKTGRDFVEDNFNLVDVD